MKNKAKDSLESSFSKFASMKITVSESRMIVGGDTCGGNSQCKETAGTDPCTYQSSNGGFSNEYDPTTTPDVIVFCEYII